MSSRSGWFKRTTRAIGDSSFWDWLYDITDLDIEDVMAVAFAIAMVAFVIAMVFIALDGGSDTSPPSAAQDANRVCRQHGGVRQLANSGGVAVCFDGVAKETGY